MFHDVEIHFFDVVDNRQLDAFKHLSSQLPALLTREEGKELYDYGEETDLIELITDYSAKSRSRSKAIT